MALRKDQKCCACERNKINNPELKLYVWAEINRICKECAEEHLTAEAYKEMTGELSKKEKDSSKILISRNIKMESEKTECCQNCEDGIIYDNICGLCNGSGEGMYDGSTCERCNGMGSGTEYCDCPRGQERLEEEIF